MVWFKKPDPGVRVEFVFTESDAQVWFDGADAAMESPDIGDGGCLSVRIQSWDVTKQHALFRSLLAKRLRVTIEEV